LGERQLRQPARVGEKIDERLLRIAGLGGNSGRRDGEERSQCENAEVQHGEFSQGRIRVIDRTRPFQCLRRGAKSQLRGSQPLHFFMSTVQFTSYRDGTVTSRGFEMLRIAAAVIVSAVALASLLHAQPVPPPAPGEDKQTHTSKPSKGTPASAVKF